MTGRMLLLTAFLIGATARADTGPDTVARGKQALEGRSFIPPVWTISAYETLWRQWGLSQKPSDFDAMVRERYGLHPAPYPNDGLPMGLRVSPGLLGKGVSTDCMVCHGGSVFGRSYVGLGNSSLDVQALFEEMNRATGLPGRLPFTFSNVRGTSEAGGMGVFLLGLRTPDLAVRRPRVELGLHDDLCEDVPAWWLLKKKKTIYHTGGGDARSVRTLMQFMMGSYNLGDAFRRHEAEFRDIQQYLLSLEPPKYPLAIDRGRAAKGQKVFEANCAKCHGTYGENWTYPNRVVKLDEIGTDPTRYRGITQAYSRYYNRSWFAREEPGWFSDGYPALPSNGYQAPPLDGIWATAPYLHNGSVPTVYDLLKSDTRPKIFTRSFRTGEEDYDPVKLGWKVRVLDQPADASLPPLERRKVYDTAQPGRGNGGHVYGDDLTEDERLAVIEYLKTI